MITAFIKGQAIETAEIVIVAESFNYLKAQFIFITSDWNGLEKTAYFTKGETTHPIKLDENNIAFPLHLSAGEWAVSVVGREYANGELVERITTDTATITVKPFKAGTETPFPEPTPTEIEALKAEIGNLSNLITSDKTSLVNAINELYSKGGSGNGDNGFSPIIDITEIDGGHRVSITDAEGKKSFDVFDGQDGADGLSAYQIWLNAGNTGTESDFLASLNGSDGVDGENGADGVSVTHEWEGTVLKVTSASGTSSVNLKGEKGDIGPEGPQGEKGEKGDTGVQGIQGEKGATGADGKDGTSVTITSVSESSVDGGSNIVEFSNGQTLTIRNGSKGSQGIKGEQGIQGIQGEKGVQGEKGDKGDKGDTGAAGKDGSDYVLTEADKAEIVAMVIELLGGNPVFGYVDENNNIIVSGNLADGSYNIKYEMEDGSTVDIGDLVLDTRTYYTVKNNLTNCTSNNNATEAVEGGSYSATITAKSGYELKTVTVTMGGTAVSVSGGVINIASVTGNIVITAVAEAIQTTKTNFFNSTNGEGGYGRIGSDGTLRTDAPNSYVTNFIPVQANDVLEISGCSILGIVNGTNTYFMAGYDSNKIKIFASQPRQSTSYCTVEWADVANSGKVTITASNISYVRFTCSYYQDSSQMVNINNIVINIKRNGAYL